MSDSDERGRAVRIRRAPKFGVFLGLGGVLGVLVALILTVSFPIDDSVGFGPTFGYFAIYGVVLGVLVGAVFAIVLDRMSSRFARTVTVSVDRLEVPDEYDTVADSSEVPETTEHGE